MNKNFNLNSSFIACVVVILSTFGLAWSQEPPTDYVHKMHLSENISTAGRMGGVSVDALGNIFVADFGDALYKITPFGKVTLFAGGFYGASGNTINKTGTVYQANFFANEITKVDRNGSTSVFASGGSLNGPVGLTVTDTDDMIVCNCNGNSIVRIKANGEQKTIASGELFSCPNGIAVGPDGELYVVNFNNDNVIKINGEGKAEVFATLAGGEGNSHIAYHNGNFYVSKIKTNQVLKLTANGKSDVLAGDGSLHFVSGQAREVGISRPNGLAVDRQTGNIYVNTLKGEWRGQKETFIEMARIEPATITKILSWQLDNKGIVAAEKAFWDYRKNPSTAHENIGPPVGVLAWRYMSQRKVGEALALFALMSEAYPERWRPWYYLGEVNKIIGQPEKALDYYKKALANDPKNEQVKGRIDELKTTKK